jgi:hypothetical protein
MVLAGGTSTTASGGYSNMEPGMDDKNADIRSIADRAGIVTFVRKHHNSEIPRTRKTTRAFLEKWDNG